MAYINRKDSDGVKPLLSEGELGYDKYVDGGDVGRVYVGTGIENLALAKKAEVDTVDGKVDNAVGRLDTAENTITELETDRDKLEAVNGTATEFRYDKRLSVLDVVGMEYNGGSTNDKLSTVIYEGDDGSTTYYRDVMGYDVDDRLATVSHFYGTVDLVTASGTTTLAYSVDGKLITATYTEV